MKMKVNLLLLSVVIIFLQTEVKGKVPGKTYNDLAEILKVANKKIEDQIDRQSLNSNKNGKQQSSEQATSTAPQTTTNVNAPSSKVQLKTPDNYKAYDFPHYHKNDQANDIAVQLNKQKQDEQQDQLKLRSYTIPRKVGQNEKLYFFLSSFILLLTCAIIIGSCFGLFYFTYKQLAGREQYIQFEDQPHPPGELKGISIEDLKKIEQAVQYGKNDRLSDSTAENKANPNSNQAGFNDAQRKNQIYEQNDMEFGQNHHQ